MKRNDLHIAVTGFAGLNNPHPGIAVARALREGWQGPIAIHALGYDSLMTGAWMPGVAVQLHLLPMLQEGDEVMLERILEIHHDVHLDAIIPCLDLELPILSRLSGRLAKEGIRTLLPSPESIYATSKLRLPKFSFDHDIRTPKTIHVLDLVDFPLHADQFGYPLVVKGTVAGAKVVSSSDRARKEAKVLNERWGGGILIQEALSGDEFVVSAVINKTGKTLGMISMRKLGINSDGKGVFGAVIDDPSVERIAKRIIGKIEWSGPLELEFIRPHGSNRLYLLEINCRFPSWIMLSHFAGCNLPVLLLQEIFEPNKRRKIPKPKPGVMFVRNVQEMAIPLERIIQLERHQTETGPASLPPRRKNGSGKGLRVAVTGLGSHDVVNPGLGVITALSQAPEVLKIIGLGYSAFDSGCYQSNILDSVYRLPAEDSPRALLEKLTEIHQINPFDVVLPCLDAEIPRFIEIESQMENLGVRTLLPSVKAFERREKLNLFTGRFKQDWGGFEIPKTFLVHSEQDVEKALRQLGLPVVVKGLVSESISADTVWEAKAAWFQLREKGYEEALVQPLIKGDDFAVAAVCDRRHQSHTLLTVKKTLKCERGSTWSAINHPQPELELSSAALFKYLKWTGPVEAEFIRDNLRSRFFLIEVNPRFTAWISFTAALGLNHPLQVVCLAMDKPWKPTADPAELVFMRSSHELPVNTRDFAAISTKGCVHYE